MLVVRDREAGYIITQVNSLVEGENLIEEFEANDKLNHEYTPNFYEVAEIED